MTQSSPSVQHFNEMLCDGLTEWFKEKAKIEEDGYYAARLQQKQLLDRNEVAIAHAVIDELSNPNRLTSGGFPVGLEVGAGYGQLSLFLCALNGSLRMRPMEMATTRFHGIEFLARILDLQYQVFPVPGQYPQQFEVGAPVLDFLLATNVINSSWTSWQAPEHEKWRKIFYPVRVDGFIIIDLERWGTHRATTDEQQVLRKKIELYTGAESEMINVEGLSYTTICKFSPLAGSPL